MNYKIIIRKRNIGTNHERYESYNNYKFVADNDARALDVVYDIQNKIEDKCKNLLPTDTCLADCLYENGRQPRHVLSGLDIDLSFRNIKQMIYVVKTENQCYNNTHGYSYIPFCLVFGYVLHTLFLFSESVFGLFPFSTLESVSVQNPFTTFHYRPLSNQNPFFVSFGGQLFICTPITFIYLKSLNEPCKTCKFSTFF